MVHVSGDRGSGGGIGSGRNSGGDVGDGGGGGGSGGDRGGNVTYFSTLFCEKIVSCKYP